MYRPFYYLARWLPMTLAMGGIFFASGITGDRLMMLNITSIGMIGHAVVFGILAITVFYAVGPVFRRCNSRWLTGTVLLICLLYGLSDVYHQSGIPGRSPRFLDLIADGCGAGFICAIRNSRFWRGLTL